MVKVNNSKTKIKKKIIREISNGRIYINASFNNTIVTITDDAGNVLSWASAGNMGFKGARKATPYASQVVTTSALEKAALYKLSSLKIFVSGVGPGRESAIRVFYNRKYNIIQIKDVTPTPHNGCRKKNPRKT